MSSTHLFAKIFIACILLEHVNLSFATNKLTFLGKMETTWIFEQVESPQVDLQQVVLEQVDLSQADLAQVCLACKFVEDILLLLCF